jgi:large-conductance mechanosensitive channel
VALAVFAMIKMLATLRAKMELLKKKEEEIKAAEEAEKPDPQIQLLTEIRDLLKKE